MAYLLDANVFIAAKNLHYGLDFCPAFWDWLVAGNVSALVFRVEKVGNEVRAVGDELSELAADRGEGFFLRPKASDFPAIAGVSVWAMGQTYEPAAISFSCRSSTTTSSRRLFRGDIRSLRMKCRRPRSARSRSPTPASGSASSA